jgi:DNA-binding XRE family transcriptional regulator
MGSMKNFDFSIIRNLRKKWGLTAETLAVRANMTRATIVKIESGNGNPTIETIHAISRVFHLSAGELVSLAEKASIETGKTSPYTDNGLEGVHIWFPDFELYHLKAAAGICKVSEPVLHENTAEVCLVLSGRVRLTVDDNVTELACGKAMRFKALHQHSLEMVEASEFLLIHHILP